MAFDTHGANGEPWTGFDLDGTLAVYDKWRGVANIGKPVKPMCDLIRKMHDEGKSVKILTARVAPQENGLHHLARVFIARWCRDNLSFVPPITHEKDALMETLYDDRVKAVEQNTGKVLNMAIEFKDMSGKTIRTGDTVEWFRNTYKVKGFSARGMGGTSYDTALLEEIGSGRTFEKPTYELRLANSTIRSRNPVVAKALNAQTSVLRETAANAKFNVGEGVLVARYHNNAIPVGKAGIIRYFDGDEYLVESGPYKGWYKESELIKEKSRSWRADIVRSGGTPRNAVVAKALNAARARNGTGSIR